MPILERERMTLPLAIGAEKERPYGEKKRAGYAAVESV
jgi:hypothetical protein